MEGESEGESSSKVYSSLPRKRKRSWLSEGGRSAPDGPISARFRPFKTSDWPKWAAKSPYSRAEVPKNHAHVRAREWPIYLLEDIEYLPLVRCTSIGILTWHRLDSCKAGCLSWPHPFQAGALPRGALLALPCDALVAAPRSSTRSPRQRHTCRYMCIHIDPDSFSNDSASL